ncbi:MAG: SpoIIE family protein phosphatase [Lentisphaeria bacterium]|nr:SpoIIE family protein phosphatase [Lentisphaeria bacterium]
MTVTVTILSIMLVIVLTAALSFYRKIEELKLNLNDENRGRTEINNFLSRFSSSINCDDGIDSVMHSMAENLRLQIEAGSVAVYGLENNKLVPLGVAGEYPLTTGDYIGLAHHQQLDRLRTQEIVEGSGFIGSIARSHHGELIPLASMDDRFSTYPAWKVLGSIIAVPMIKDGVVYGVICAVDNKMLEGKPFSVAQMNRMQSFSGQILMARQLVDTYEQLRRRERLVQEVDFVRSFQNSLLPPSTYSLGDFHVFAHTTSAKEVNGDFFDIVEIDEDRILVMVGDSCGKGMPACILGSMARSFARAIARQFTTLTEFLQMMNSNLQRDSDAARYITLGCCLIDKKRALLEFGRAGHTEMIMHVHDHLRRLSPHGTALGLLPDDLAEFETICLAIDHGTTIMLYSDGLNEALDHDHNEFGTERLANAFHVACDKRDTPSEIIDDVMEVVHHFEFEQNDDQTIVLIHRD